MQRELGLMQEAQTSETELIDMKLLNSCTSFCGAMKQSVLISSKKQCGIASAMGTDPGNVAKGLKGAINPIYRYPVKFMNETGNYAPLQWLADRCGFILVKKKDERIASLEKELEEKELELVRLKQAS